MGVISPRTAHSRGGGRECAESKPAWNWRRNCCVEVECCTRGWASQPALTARSFGLVIPPVRLPGAHHSDSREIWDFVVVLKECITHRDELRPQVCDLCVTQPFVEEVRIKASLEEQLMMEEGTVKESWCDGSPDGERKERRAGWSHMKFAQCGAGKEGWL